MMAMSSVPTLAVSVSKVPPPAAPVPLIIIMRTARNETLFPLGSVPSAEMSLDGLAKRPAMNYIDPRRAQLPRGEK